MWLEFRIQVTFYIPAGLQGMSDIIQVYADQKYNTMGVTKKKIVRQMI